MFTIVATFTSLSLLVYMYIQAKSYNSTQKYTEHMQKQGKNIMHTGKTKTVECMTQ